MKSAATAKYTVNFYTGSADLSARRLGNPIAAIAGAVGVGL
jgi:hypothetical protein